jgi:type VI secretion system protein ImpH
MNPTATQPEGERPLAAVTSPALPASAALRPATTASPPAAAPPRDRSLSGLLFREPYRFDFFQATRVLEKLSTERKAVGRTASPAAEIVRYKAHVSLSFPPSSLYDLVQPTNPALPPTMIVAFMGLHGPSGVLPRHYTELLIRIEKESKGPERNALREWFDLFNHRFISLFHRAWEKYRFFIPYERGEYAKPEPDTFTLALFSLVGLGIPPLRGRLHVSTIDDVDGYPQPRRLAHIDDLALLYYGGYFAHRPRNAVSLEGLLRDYFQLPVAIHQFQGQWLVLTPENQSRLGEGNNQLGVNVVAGERVWDVQNKFRIRLGPLDAAAFTHFLPDRSPTSERKAFFLLTHLVRLYVGPEFDFEVQLVLKAEDVPECCLTDGLGIGPCLGWNTWLRSQPMQRDAEDAVFAGDEVTWIGSWTAHG